MWDLTPHGLERGVHGEWLLHSRGETPPQEQHHDSCTHGKGLSTESHHWFSDDDLYHDGFQKSDGFNKPPASLRTIRTPLLDTKIVTSMFNFLLTTLTFDLNDFSNLEDQRIHH